MNATEVLAIRINEVEPNPLGKDAGNEWIELYSEEEINLEGYYIQADDKTYNLSGIFSGYYSITFPGLWIDNSNETIFLKNSQGIIDETDVLADSKNNEESLSFCEGEWVLQINTRDQYNGCDDVTEEIAITEEIVEEENDEEEPIENISNDNLTEINTINSPKKQTENKKIVLKNDKLDIKEEITPAYKVRVGVIYAFVGLCALLVILMALRKL